MLAMLAILAMRPGGLSLDILFQIFHCRMKVVLFQEYARDPRTALSLCALSR